jgi:hypothetical protein
VGIAISRESCEAKIPYHNLSLGWGGSTMARKAKKSAKRTSSKKRKKKSPGMLASAMKTVRKGARKLGL